MSQTPPETPSKKLLEKQQRRMAEEAKAAERKRAAMRRNLVTFVVITVVLALVIVMVMRDRQEKDQPVGVAAAEAGCTEIERPEEQGRDHIEEGAQHAPYSSSPPTSGPHYGSPADAAFYDQAIAPETVVHNMEHGQVVIWFRPDLEPQVKDELEVIQRQEALATVALPSAEVREPYAYVITAWGAMQSCEKVSNEVIDAFREEFQGRGPENVGVPVFEAGEEA